LLMEFGIMEVEDESIIGKTAAAAAWCCRSGFIPTYTARVGLVLHSHSTKPLAASRWLKPDLPTPDRLHRLVGH
jgi:hypothetical protein